MPFCQGGLLDFIVLAELELSRSHSPEEAEEPTEPTRRIDFDHLQFGKDYEIK